MASIFSKRKNGNSLEAELVDLRSRRAALANRLTEAQAAVTTAHDARRRQLVEGDVAGSGGDRPLRFRVPIGG
jgi:hypothetical protein